MDGYNIPRYSLRNIIKLSKQSPPRPRLFSLPGQLKVTRYFLPKLHYYRTFYYFKVLNSKEFLT